ncbi:ABC transporter ATP-binding protein [Levilactobacillus enshiensis]|uniref:ABC transporter ATP-binding protein n=1 Tax=Levilactobacillus enshiensis TaxID=2590213 RepID=UPI00117A4DC0|nr:ABC transporter ATP-binding protein [Levilactobacillus enshiensis]
MGKLIQLDHLAFTYPGQTKSTLNDISLTIEAGAFVTIVGATGSGKTTLLKQLKPELQPAGEQMGQVRFHNQPLTALSSVASAQQLGYVAQDPQTQPIMATVIEELAFPLENLGVDSAAMTMRIAELSNFLGLDKLLHQTIDSLSGGQLQLVNLASVLALKPEVILLDEPTAQLDPTTAQNFLTVLQQVHDELGITIILTEHRLSRVLSMADQLVLLTAGQVTYAGPVSPGLRQMHQTPELRAFVPPVPEFFLAHELPVRPLPLTVTAGRQALQTGNWHFAVQPAATTLKVAATPLLTAREITRHYENGSAVLRQLNLTVNTGDWLAIIGKNGSGKSTLLTILAGLQKPQHGKVRLNQQIVWKLKNGERLAHIGYLSQNPTEQFSGETVIAELTAQAKLVGRTDIDQAVQTMLTTCHLTRVAEQNAFDLSGGQQQLLGLGLALMAQPELLLLDEPTKGLDPDTKQHIGGILQQAHQAGLTVVMASHDMDFCAAFATNCTFMFDGQVSQPQSTRTFFTSNFLSTTAVNRLLRQQVPSALFWQDVRLTTKGGELQSNNDDNKLTGA